MAWIKPCKLSSEIQTKKFIYKRYSEDENNRKITYNTFIKNIPKNYKYSKRRTDMCGICSIGENLHKIDKNKLNDKEKEELKEQIELYENHLKVVQNQKDQYNKLKNNLKENECIVIMDFKENFNVSYKGD